MKILFRSPMTTNSGYGNDGIGMALGLIDKGVDLRLIPMHVSPPLPRRLVDRFELPVEAPFDIYLNHSDPGRFEVSDAARKSCELTMGWTMWEYCVDEETEIFTRRGWLSWDEVQIGDESLAIDPETGTADWQTIEDVYVGPVLSRPLHSIETHGVSALTTFNHRWLIRDNTRAFRWVTSETLKTGHGIPRSVPVQAADEKHEDAFVELMAWLYTEGWLERGTQFRVGQSSVVNPEYCERIRAALQTLFGDAVSRNAGGRTWSENIKPDGMVVWSLGRGASAEFLALMEEKVPTIEFVTSLSSRQAQLFVDVSLMADGHKDRFGQKFSTALDAFEAAVIVAGWAYRPRSGGSGQVTTKVLRRSAYTKPMEERGEVNAQDYTGRVWCPTLRHHNWLARRRGRVYYTGNTTLQNMDVDGRYYLARCLRDLDVFVSYDDVTHQAFEHYMDRMALLPKSHPFHMTEDERPLHVIAQGGYIPGDWRAPEGDEDQRNWSDDGPFRFCMVGQLHIRKDPMVAVMAFKELKEEMGSEFADAELHLKTAAPGLHSSMEEWVPKLRIHYASWPQQILQQFYWSMNVLLAPSRGEGKNMPALEMLSSGGSVIATNWGGHTTWMDPTYAYPLDYTLAPEPPFEQCMSARASKDHLKELMWHCYTHRDEVKRKGEMGSVLIPQRQNWDAATENMLRIVNDALPHDKIQTLLAIARRGT